MSKRVKRSSTLQWFAIGALLFAGASHVCVAQSKLSGIVDTSYKNATTILGMKETDDCSVRAISEAFDITYESAHAIVESWGREYRQGILWSQVQNGIFKDFPFTASTLYVVREQMNSFKFVSDIAEDGSVYIILADKHMFVIEQGVHCQWLVKGNLDDAPKQILGFLIIRL